MADLLGTDHPLSIAQRAQLDALLDTLLPASTDGRLPSAAAVDFPQYLNTQAADLLTSIAVILGHLGDDFAELTDPEQIQRVNHFSQSVPDLFKTLLTHVYDCYYQNGQVRHAIGMVQGAVFPEGNEVLSGDLSLLDPVIDNQHRHQYRKV